MIALVPDPRLGEKFLTVCQYSVGGATIGVLREMEHRLGAAARAAALAVAAGMLGVAVLVTKRPDEIAIECEPASAFKGAAAAVAVDLFVNEWHDDLQRIVCGDRALSLYVRHSPDGWLVSDEAEPAAAPPPAPALPSGWFARVARFK